MVWERAAIKYEDQLVVPWPMRSDPIKHQQGTDLYVNAEFFGNFAPSGKAWRFIGLSHSTWHVPMFLVGWVDKEDPADLISKKNLGCYSFSGLLGIAFR
jgi:hypothetical protein